MREEGGLTALVFVSGGIRMAAPASGIEGIVDMQRALEEDAKIIDLSTGVYIDAGESRFKDKKALMVKGADKKIGIAADDLEEIASYDGNAVKSLPPLVAASGKGMFKGAVLKGEDVVLLVDPCGGSLMGWAETGNKDSQEVR